MAYITKEKLNELIRNRPTGVSPSEIIRGLKIRGHILEIEQNKDLQEGSRKEENLLTSPLKTIARSAGEFVKGVAGAITHPIETAKGLAKTFMGAEQKFIFSPVFKAITGKEPVKPEEQQIFENVENFYKQRYGSIDRAKDTFLKDPIGFLVDASIILSGTGGVLSKAGKISKIGKISKAGEILSETGRIVEPVSKVTKLATTVTKPISKLITKKIPKLSLTKIASSLTRVEEDVIKRYFDNFQKNPEKMKELKRIVVENPKQPLNPLIHKISEKINSLREEAKKQYQDALEEIRNNINPEKTYNVKETIPDVDNILKKHSLKIEDIGDNRLKLKPRTRVNPFNPKEMKDINNIIEGLNLENATAEELLNLDILTKDLLNKYSRMDNKKMVALLTELTDKTSKYIDKQFPEIDLANNLYKKYYEVLKFGGNKIINAEGEIKPGAESFLSNSVNLNKGKIREDLQKMSEIIGENIIDDVNAIKDIRKLSEDISHTYVNRTQDIIKGLFGFEAVLSPSLARRIGSAVLYIIARLATSPEKVSRFLEWLSLKQGTPMSLEIKNSIKPFIPDILFILGETKKQIIPNNQLFEILNEE